MNREMLHLPALAKLASAERSLQEVLDHAPGELNATRIRMALSMIKLERLKQQDETKRAGRLALSQSMPE